MPLLPLHHHLRVRRRWKCPSLTLTLSLTLSFHDLRVRKAVIKRLTCHTTCRLSLPCQESGFVYWYCVSYLHTLSQCNSACQPPSSIAPFSQASNAQTPHTPIRTLPHFKSLHITFATLYTPTHLFLPFHSCTIFYTPA